MSTSNTHQHSLADAGSETKPLLLERGSYIPLASQFRRYLNRKRENRKWLNKAIDEGPNEFKDFTPSETEAPRKQKEEDLRGDDLKHYEAEIEAMNLILISIPNDIYNSVDACTTAQAMWQRVERSSSRTTTPYYVTHPSLVVDYDDDYQGDAVQNNFEDPLTSAMILLAPQCFSNPTNDRLRTSSNTKNQAIVQDDRGNNVQNDAGNIQRNLRITSSGTAANFQCYNCSEKGHYGRNCPKPRVRDSKYFMEQMLLAKQDKAGVTLTNEQNDFLFVDASRMEEIKELSANICLMARIQPANFDSDAGPSYDYAFHSEIQTPSTSYVNPLFAKDNQE
ncbi:retrovirus-related pol polyprotein from transposon TNT 1-94 [Tanacetum coccineum]